MGRKKHSIKGQMGVDKAAPIDRLDSMSIHELSLMSQAAPLALQNRLEKALRSENVEDVLKAQAFIAQQERNGRAVKPDIKSILWNPSDIGFNGRGYRDPNNGIPFTTLQRMGDIYIIKAIINTRIEQIQNFLRYSDDDQKPGFQLRYKRMLGGDIKEIFKKDMKVVEGLVRFLEDGGENDKWSSEDNFQDFTRKTIKDSLCLDQLCFEVVRSRSMKVNKFRAVDASLIRQLDTDDPRYASMFEQYRWHGYLPRYAMVYDSQIIRNPATDELVIYYPWELGYGIRNKTTNVFRNGYGCSELETLIEVVTWILWGMQYNGNFFKQGSQPKGFINVKNSNIDQGTLNEFRQDWKQTMSTVYNAHKIPVIQGIDLEWIDLQQSNKDMEFTEWIKFLFVVTCAVYRIDPSELGFQFQDAARVFGQDGQKERLDHSQKKGLFPLLVFFQNIVNRYIISEIDDRFEFVFTGVDIKDESAQVDIDKKKLDAGVVSLEDMFRKYSGRDLDPEKDTILNSIYQTAQSNKMMGGEDMNEAVDEMNGEGGNGDDFDIADMLMQKSQGNPILGKALEFIDNQLSAK
nr:MAG TPA: Portal protein [Herelleviridae sp.]